MKKYIKEFLDYGNDWKNREKRGEDPIGFKESTQNTYKNAFAKLYNNLHKNIGDGTVNPGSWLRKTQDVQKVVQFALGRKESFKNVLKFLDKNPRDMIDGVVGSEWAMFFRLGDWLSPRMKDLIKTLTVEDFSSDYSSIIYKAGKTGKTKSKTFTKAESKFIKEYIENNGLQGSDRLFEGINNLYKKNNNTHVSVGNVLNKAGVKVAVILPQGGTTVNGAKVPKYGVLEYGDVGTEGAKLSSLFRGWSSEDLKGLGSKNEKGALIELQKILQHSSPQTSENFYLKLDQKIISKRTTKKKKSFFSDQNVTDKSELPFTKESFDKFLTDFVLKRNPNIKVILSNPKEKGRLGLITKKFIEVYSGVSTIKDFFHESGHDLKMHIMASGNKELIKAWKQGEKLISPDAKVEWLKNKRLRDKYKKFDTFIEEYFVEHLAKISSERYKGYKNLGLFDKVSKWMNYMYKKFQVQMFGAEKLNIDDLSLMFGEMNFRGFERVQDVRFRNTDGSLKFSVFSSKSKKTHLEIDSAMVNREIGKHAKRIGMTAIDLRDTVLKSLGYNSLAEITTKKDFGYIQSWLKHQPDYLDRVTSEFHTNFELTRKDIKDSPFLIEKLGLSKKTAAWITGLFVPPPDVLRKFGKHGRFLADRVERFSEANHRHMSILSFTMDHIEYLAKKSGMGKKKFMESLAVYDAEVIKTGLKPHQATFKANLEKDPWFKDKTKKPKSYEARAVKAVQEYYTAYYNAMRRTIKENYNPYHAKKMLAKLDKKHIKNYFTHSLTKEVKDFLNSEPGDRFFKEQVRQHLFKDHVAKDKRVKSLLGQLKKAKKEKDIKKEDSIREKINEIQNEILSKEQKDGRTLLEKVAAEIMDQFEHSSDNIINPNIDLHRFGFLSKEGKPMEFILDTNTGKQLRVWDVKFENTIYKYGHGVSRMLAQMEVTPELPMSAKGAAPKFIKTALADIYANHGKEAHNYANDVIHIVFRGKFESDKPFSAAGKFWRNIQKLSQLSATMGLSSPFSAVKNTFLGQAGISSAFGLRAMKAGWEGMLDPNMIKLAQSVSAKQIGVKYLSEVMGTNWITKPMEVTEWANRIMGVAASHFYVKDAISLLRGEKANYFTNIRKDTVMHILGKQLRLTKKEVAHLVKFGIEPNKISSVIRNSKKVQAETRRIQEKVAHWGHQITQGSTGPGNLPLWMSGQGFKQATLFWRMAASMANNNWKNVITPLGLGNPIPLIRYGAAHTLSGWALLELHEAILGSINPQTAFKDNEINVLKEYGARGELLSLASNFLMPRSSPGGSITLADSFTPVNLRNATVGFNAALEIINAAGDGLGLTDKGKSKTVFDSLDDALTQIFVAYNHSKRLWFKTTAPYLTEYNNAKKIVSTFAINEGLKEQYYGQETFLNERSPYYRTLKHSFMLGESHGQHGYINKFWAAYEFILQSELEKYPPKNLEEKKYYRKKVLSILKRKINGFNPVYFSETSKEGKDSIRRMMNKLKDEDAYFIRKSVNNFKDRKTEFWKQINLSNKDGRFTNF